MFDACAWVGKLCWCSSRQAMLQKTTMSKTKEERGQETFHKSGESHPFMVIHCYLCLQGRQCV